MPSSAPPSDLADVYISQAGFVSKNENVHDQRSHSDFHQPEAKDVDLELHRYNAMQQLREAFDSHVTKVLGLRVAHQTFEKWLFCALHFSSATKSPREVTRAPQNQTQDAKHASGSQHRHLLAEPLLPRITSIGQAPKADSIVIDAVADAGGSRENGIHLLKALYSAVVRLLAFLAARSSVATGTTSAAWHRVLVNSKLDSVTVVCKSQTTGRAQISRERSGVHSSSRRSAGSAAQARKEILSMRLALSIPHFRKLRALFDRACGQNSAHKLVGDGKTKDIHSESAFRRALFCLLARYRSLSGDYSQGAGFQAAVPPACLQVMQKLWDVDCECFASPLNCFFPNFCSLFPDTDRPFGSLGSFFDLQPQSGSFQVNPPFSREVIDAMAEHLLNLLDTAEQSNTPKPLSFIVIIPKWDDCEGWKRLASSRKFLHGPPSKNKSRTTTFPEPVLLRQRRHRYLEGAQHDRAVHVSGNLEGRRISTCDTSIFFMQTSEAARRWPVTQEGVDQLICAFGGRPFSGTPFHKTAAPAVPNLVSVKGCSKQSLDGTYILHSVDYAQRSGGNSDARTPSVVYKHQKLAWGKQHWLYSQFEEKDQQSPIGKHQGESRKKKTRALCPIRWFIGHDRVSSRKVQSSAVGRAGSAVGPVGLHWAIFTQKHGWCLDKTMEVSVVPSNAEAPAPADLTHQRDVGTVLGTNDESATCKGFSPATLLLFQGRDAADEVGVCRTASNEGSEKGSMPRGNQKNPTATAKKKAKKLTMMKKEKKRKKKTGAIDGDLGSIHKRGRHTRMRGRSTAQAVGTVQHKHGPESKF